jgi:osmotically-inducible protein OsmY
MKKNIIKLLCVTLATPLILSMTGCANAVLVATDPRPVSTVTSDQYITQSLGVKYMSDEFESDHVKATVYNHRVLLTGQVVNDKQRDKALAEVKEFDSIQKIFDYLVVSPQYTSTSSEDTYITGQVKMKLIGAGNVNSNDGKIVTEHGVVYILGIIKKSQLENMLNEAKSVDGVKKVVPLLQYKNSDTKLNLPGTE